MNNVILAQIKHGQITSSDRALMENFIENATKSSSVSLMLQRILTAHDSGVDVEVFASDAELTPNQAAAFLKMSRPHLLTFMDRGDLKFHYVGETRKHRKIKMRDLLKFKDARAAGQKIVGTAVRSPQLRAADEKPLTQDEIDQLNSL